jgi:hypothetical protein
MATKLWEKVNIITGQSSKSRNLVPLINAGAKFIVSSLPEKFLWSIASETEINGWSDSAATSASISEGSGIAYDKILAVYRQDGTDSNGNAKKRIAEEVSDKGIHIFDESSSLLKPTKMFPKFYKLSGKIYIKPAPDYNASSSTQSYTPVGGSSTNVTTLNGDKGVIVYAAPPETDENTDVWVLVEYENIVLYYAASLDMKRLCQSYRDSITTHLSTITGTYLASFESALPTLADVAVPVKPSLPSLSSSAISETIDAIPDYVSQVMAVMPTVGGGEVTIPTAPDIQSIFYTPPSDITLTNAFSISESLPSFAKPVITFDWTKTDDALLKAELLIDVAGGTSGDPGITKDAEAWLEEEDPEMVTSVLSTAAEELSRAQTAVSKQQRELERYSQEVEAEAQKFSAEVNKFRTSLEKVTSEATNKTTAYTARVQEEQGKAQLKVEQYKTDLERYASRVESALSEFSQKSTINIQEYTAKVQEGLQKYSSKSESSLGKFSAQVQQAVAEEQRKVSEFTAKSTQELQSFGADIQSYASQTQAEIQSFGAKLQKASAYLAKAATLMQVVGELNAECQMAQQDSQDYYQRAVNELRAISGVLTAPPQQQSEQRQEQGATS